ncbi:hypothetical protein E2C01_076744 [Portunus trituberculatus]|uniref:Uncharacterized protein n=1 Tax=Portunus trituberculatus TaxID=210409 RepID=A0A5B7IJF1_PORTR|nr:hypothetical protein [Portunus trituberculatus]
MHDQQTPQTMELLHHSVALPDDTCVPVIHNDFSQQLNISKSTAPGKDGITCDILKALLADKRDNPILDQFNMSLTAGNLLLFWKAAIIILSPKCDGTFRPISYLIERGAFNRANKDVIMEELILKGVKGRLLGWTTCKTEQQRVHTRKYLDVQLSFKKSPHAVHYV